jgi:hypothetical protein
MSPNPSKSSDARFAHVESSIASLATTVGDFIKESREDRERRDREDKSHRDMLWQAIKEQGVSLQTSIEKLSTRNQITWPMICSTLGVVLGLVTAGAGVNNALMEARIKQTEIRQEFLQKELDQKQPQKP